MPEEWRPNAGRQEQFLASTAYEALYGGAAGGGKSEALLLGALRYVGHGAFRGILFRRTYPELERSLIERSHLYDPRAAPGASYNSTQHVWRFPSGARVYFSHLEHNHSVHDHQSAEYQYLAFDEVTSFTEYQYRYMLSRVRSSAGLPLEVRAGTNPGGEGHEWVMKRWAPWLDTRPEYMGPRARPGEKLWYVNRDDGEAYVTNGSPGALSRVFIPARLEDNPKLDAGYEGRLMGLDVVNRKRLRDGDWLVKPAAGLYFKRAWFRFVDEVPAGARFVRHWDLAATEAEEGKSPDWTVGVKLARLGAELFVANVIRLRATPGEVERTILATAELDGRDVEISLPQDPGQAGKFQAEYLVGQLQGFTARADPESGDKVTRAGPFSAQAEAGNVRLVRASWNESLLEELEAFPSAGVHDDQVDAVSGAYRRLADAAPGYGDLPSSAGKWSSRGRRGR